CVYLPGAMRIEANHWTDAHTDYSVLSKRRLVTRAAPGICGYRRECGRRKGHAGNDVKVQDVVAVDEHDLTPLRSVERVADPVAGSFGDLTASHDEGMIH